MLKEFCLICNEEITSEGHFWKKHKIKAESYYLSNYNKKDLFTNEPLPYKNREYYLLNDFLNRQNLNKYLNTLKIEDRGNYCIELIERRKEFKNLSWTPSQVELRSLICPSIITFQKIYPDQYYDICSDLGLKNKFTFLPKEKIFKDSKYNSGYQILIDTREQYPFKFSIPIEIKKLDFGDYTLSNIKECNNIYIERKNISDFISTLSSGYDRFIREIQRCYDANSKLIIVVEASLSYTLSFNYSKWLSKFIKATPDFIFHRVRELYQTYPNIQFVFVDGPEKAAKISEIILTSNGICADIDIQYAIDDKLIDIEF